MILFRPRWLPLIVALLLLLLAPSSAWAGPVEWREVEPTAAGRQWWDAGSLRIDRHGHLTVLSRFQPAAVPGQTGPGQPSSGQAGSPVVDRPLPSRLYVMEIDCAGERYRDTAVNGLPRFRAEWQGTQADALTRATLRAACRAGADLVAVASRG